MLTKEAENQGAINRAPTGRSFSDGHQASSSMLGWEELEERKKPVWQLPLWKARQVSCWLPPGTYGYVSLLVSHYNDRLAHILSSGLACIVPQEGGRDE